MAQGKVLAISLKDYGITDFGKLKPRGFAKTNVSAIELFINDKRMQLARWPDYNDNAKTDSGFVKITDVNGDTNFSYDSDRPKRWSKATDIWLHGFWKYYWADLHVKVKKLDADKRTVSLFEKPGYGISKDQPFYFYNLLE